MTRFIGCGNARRVVQSLIQNQNSSSVDIIKIRLYDRAGFNSFSRLFLYNKHTLSEYTFHKPSNGLFRGRYFRSFHSVAETSLISHRTHIAWKRIFQICSYGGSVFPRISRIACAISLALTRSNLVPHGIIAFVAGEFALRRRMWAEAEYIPSSNSMYRSAHEGRVYFTSFLLSLLEFLVLLIRVIHLAALFAPCLVSAPFVNSRHRKTWLRLVHRTLEKAGPAFIKWGQWAATRPDLFAGDLCGELSKLHANAPAHSFLFTKKSVERAFGRKIHEIFETFEEEPVASGSVAQVHQATLKYRYPGQAIEPVVVAVKVRHPGVGEAIRRDFAIINFLAKISRLVPGLDWLRLDESVRQFAVFMMSQVDLSREAAHLSRFIYNFRSWKDVSFPKPLYPLVHPSVLVETYERGESVMHYVDEVKGHEQIKTALAHIGSHALLKMLLVDNFIHADMHPGNILVRVTDNKPPHELLFKSKPHVVFLDVGMTAELSKWDRANLLEFFKAVAVKDGRNAAERTLRLSAKQNCPNPKAFIQEVEKSFRFWDSPEGESVSTGDCIKQLLEQVRRHKVNIDGNVCTVMVTTLVLEGWQQKLDPEYDVMHTLRSLLFKADWAESFSYTIEGLMAP